MFIIITIIITLLTEIDFIILQYITSFENTEANTWDFIHVNYTVMSWQVIIKSQQVMPALCGFTVLEVEWKGENVLNLINEQTNQF